MMERTSDEAGDNCSPERMKMERKFAELKKFHGLKETSYWGLAKIVIQFTMTAIACNLEDS
ncbi:MAG: transposase [Dehalococcoidales bacterium]|nr:transposase [Dehalococcoidales bacterium]